jgi:murein DD-endopeptidase MepM/ murein hydrolase activator NlpD
MRNLIWQFGHYFTEKQIYVRSKGSVRYLSLSSRSQSLLVIFAILLSGWLAFTSVRTILADRIEAQAVIDLKNQIVLYQDKLNKLQADYDSLNGQLALATDWFDETTSRLEARHKAITSMLERHAAINEQINDMQDRFAEMTKRTRRTAGETRLVAAIGLKSSATLESRLSRQDPMNSGTMLTNMEDPTPVDETASSSSPLALMDSETYHRIDNLSVRQKDLLDAIEENTDRALREYAAIIDGTNLLKTDVFVAQIVPEDERATGGPYMPLATNGDLGESLDQQLFRISSNLERLDNLSQAIRHIPLARPIHNFRQTSGFGPRIDPIQKRPAFHSGADFGTPTGTAVYSTLAGVVTYAGNRGPYGKVVEIDHGNGFKTRYAHLNKTRVRRGQTVGFQDQIGDSGNTGRSTGPHLHYEIWYEGRVRDPQSFLTTGQQIFSVSETLGSD